MKSDNEKHSAGLSSLDTHILGCHSVGDSMPGKKQNDITDNVNERTHDEIDRIYSAIATGQVDFKYAMTGYNMSNGDPIYDYNLMVETLVAYGYDVHIASDFIADFSESGEVTIMCSSKIADILTNVQPLPEND